MDNNKNLKKILNLLKDNKEVEALELYEKNCDKINSKKDENYKFLKNYFFELKYLNWIKNSKDAISDIFNEGLNLLNNGRYEEAYNCFLELNNSENEVIFLYYLGLCSFKQKDYKTALHFFMEYSKTDGALNLEKCCNYIIQIYENWLSKSQDESEIIFLSIQKMKAVKKLEFIDNVKNDKFYVQEKNLKLCRIDYQIETDIIKLIKEGKINNIVTEFENSDYIRKINILALLYRNGLKNQADKLLKKNKDDLSKNCNEYLNTLCKNKALYLAQAKYGVK